MEIWCLNDNIQSNIQILNLSTFSIILNKCLDAYAMESRIIKNKVKMNGHNFK
jgi:hypothetical protein